MSVVEQTKLLFRAWKYRLYEDPAEIAYLLKAIKRGQAVMDIGAHKGGYTYWLQKAVEKKGCVYAFEPQKTGAGLLKSLFKAKPNVFVEEQALSNKIGAQAFYIQPQSNSVSFEASIANKYESAQETTVKIITLDAYCASKNIQPSFLKIDVEGHEWEVLQGAKELLTSIKPILLIEMEERHIGQEKMQAIFQLLRGFDYKGFFFLKGSKTSLAQFDANLHQQLTHLANRSKLYCNNFVFEPYV